MSPSFQQAHHHPSEGSPLQHHNSTTTYAPTLDHDDNEAEGFFDQLKNVINQTPKKDIRVVQKDWKTNVGKNSHENWQAIYGLF